MGINMIDATGQPRSDEDLQESIDALKNALVTQRMTLPPMLTVQLPCMIELLTELQGFRELVKKIKAKQAGG